MIPSVSQSVCQVIFQKRQDEVKEVSQVNVDSPVRCKSQTTADMEGNLETRFLRILTLSATRPRERKGASLFEGNLPCNGKEMLGSNVFSGNTDGCNTCQCFPLFEGAYHATLVAHAMCIVKPHEQSEARLVKMILTVLLSL